MSVLDMQRAFAQSVFVGFRRAPCAQMDGPPRLFQWSSVSHCHHPLLWALTKAAR